jgi:hypothetical protein
MMEAWLDLSKQRHQLQDTQSTTPSLSHTKLMTNFLMSYDIDTSPNDILEVNVHGFGGPRLNADQWGRLPKEAHEKWDQLDQSSKAIILEHKLRPPPGSSVRGLPRRDFGRPTGGHFTPRNHPADTAVNLHEISAAEYLAYNHQMSLG